MSLCTILFLKPEGNRAVYRIILKHTVEKQDMRSGLDVSHQARKQWSALVNTGMSRLVP
jgi:hypothetical protein